MTSEANAKAIERENAILADLVSEHQPQDEQAFRLACRARWRAVEALLNGASDAEYVEMLNSACSSFPVDELDEELSVKYVVLMITT